MARRHRDIPIPTLHSKGAGPPSGWLYTTDAYWGVERVERLHALLALLADLLLVLAGLHVAGVLFTSARQRENLVAAMVHGRKPRTTGHDTATPG